MTENDVLRYLYLIDRKLTLLTSGINWKPEYEEEVTDIDKEILQLRKIINARHKKVKV